MLSDVIGLEQVLVYCGFMKPKSTHPPVQLGPNLFDTLPYEILLRVASFLHARDLLRLGCVSRIWFQISRDQVLWRSLCTVELGFHFIYDHQTEESYKDVNWRRMFKQLQGQDCQPTYHDSNRKILGCIHYQRSCKIKPTCCGKWSSCRICHDQQTDDHVMDRFATQEMMCMSCKTIQPVAATCNGEKCKGRRLARYYCPICKLWEDNEKKDIYHCFHCGFCRLGRESEFYHCFQCSMCISVTVRSIHRCKPGQTKGQCPVCNKLGPMWNGLAPILFLPCGDAVHVRCYQHLLSNDLPCPVCRARVDVEME